MTEGWLNLCLDPININSVLNALRVGLLAVSYLMLLLAKVMCVSSAYIQGSEFKIQLGKSLMYTINRSGPRIVP